MNRRMIFLGLAAGLSFPGAVSAQFVGPGPQDDLSTLADVARMRVGSYVTVEGNILSRLRDDYYDFADETGQMRVEIDPGLFADRTVTPETRVRLRGEVNTGLRGRYIYVEALTFP